MNSILKKAGLGAALAATALTAAVPAEAQRWHGGRGGWHGGRGGNAAGAAVLGGIVGLGLGAAIASNNNRGYYRDGYYDRGYRGYDGYYDRGYYYDDYYSRPRCRTTFRWDPYYGERVPVRICR
ncbi:hypothetical protein [Sphingomonas immobilis]|uniref:Uncharacterized protein n=1 Tax=Sphingomonas immobilis TaxID=3063997 RepID=A0ABT9A2J7_9SPHN|nr:hypothetical protein [Sphingomonas sp. CA1-15]MDO7844066.1 hypothetical protein [Sphingomonas sp. CA1-15]